MYCRPEPEPCNSEEHTCPADGTCIPLFDVCNFRNDCPVDNSDEAGCPPIYTFDECDSLSACLWNVVTPGTLNWDLASVGTDPSGLPPVNYLNTTEGHFMQAVLWIIMIYSQNPNQKGSKVLPEPNPNNLFGFGSGSNKIQIQKGLKKSKIVIQIQIQSKSLIKIPTTAIRSTPRLKTSATKEERKIGGLDTYL
jgi:hypothetical protein